MRGSEPVKGATRARVLLILIAVLGLSVSGFGLTQVVAALAAAPGNPVITALDDGRPVSAAALNRLLASRRAALVWARSPRFYRDIGRVARILARRAGDDRAGAEAAFRRAAEATESGLWLAPVDPASWLRLAAIRLDVDADPDAALEALRATVRSGPYDPYRTERRVRMVLRLWPVLEGSDRVLFQRQFQYLWDEDPAALARLALDERVYLIAWAMLDDVAHAEALKERRDEILRSRQ